MSDCYPKLLDSTIGSKSHVQRLGRRRYASKFDHSVSKRFILFFWSELARQLSDKVGTERLVELIHEEIAKRVGNSTG